MFLVTRNGPHRVDIEFSGKLNAASMRTALDDLIAKTEDIENGSMLYRISDFDFPTLAALGVELSMLPRLFGLIRKFDRCAVLADTSWVRKVSELEGKLFPGLEIKAFEPHQAEAAEEWLAGA